MFGHLCCVCVSRSVMSDSATPWPVARQAPLSMEILQARIPEWVAMPSSRGSSNPGIDPGLPHCRWILYQLSHQGSSGGTFQVLRFACMCYLLSQLHWVREPGWNFCPALSSRVWTAALLSSVPATAVQGSQALNQGYRM